MNLRSFESIEPRLGDSVHVDPTALVIGDVIIGAESSVWPMAVIRGDVHSIRIGERTNIQDGTIVHVTHDGEFSQGGFATHVGDDVTVGHRAVIHACTVGSRVLLGMGSIVMDGAEVGDEVIVGAGALVTSGARLESGWLYLGSPAKPVRRLRNRERDFLVYSARHYAKLAWRHRQAGKD